MKLNKLKSLYLFDSVHKKAFVYFNVPKIWRSNEQISLKMLQAYGVKIINRIPIIALENRMGDTRIGIAGRKIDLFICEYRTSTNEKITFGYYPNSYFVFEKSTNKLGIYLVKRLVQKEHNKLPKTPEKTVKNLVDLFNEFLDNEYINEDTKSQIVKAVTPYISTFKRRRDFNINMCLSVVFTGEPGDGKTYLANKIARWFNMHLGLTHVSEEVTVFEKAAKLVPDFVAVIDDMNVAHFRREGPGAVICQNILSEMDHPGCNRLFFLTTNETVSHKNIDKAFFRPGRIQDVIVFKRPDNNLKKRIISDVKESLEKNNLSISNEFVSGVEFYSFEDSDLSLAEIMRLKNLILTDIIMGKELSHPESYIARSKRLKVKEGEDIHDEIEV